MTCQDTEDSLDFQEIDSDLANTLTLTSTTTPVVKGRSKSHYPEKIGHRKFSNTTIEVFI